MTALVPPDVVAALVRRGLLADRPSGPTLAEVLRARVPLTGGEAATVAIPVAEALDALHGAGVAYGPPTARDVLFGDDGRPVLALPRAWSERPDDDVPGLLRAVLGAMAPVLPASTGLPGADGADDEPDLRPVLVGLLADGCRSGAEVARTCVDTVVPEPVRLPDAGALARAHVLGVGEGAGLPRRLPRRGAGDDRRGSGAVLRVDGRGTGSRASARRAERRRARRRTRVRVAILAVVVLVVLAVVLARPSAVAARDERPVTGSPVATDRAPGGDAPAIATDPVLDRAAPAAAGAALTRRRATAIAAGDMEALGAVDLPDGPARASDESLLGALGAGRPEGLSVDVQGARALDDEAGDEVDVLVTSAMSPYRLVRPDGTEVAVAGMPPRTVVLRLRWTDDGWRVRDVGPPPEP